jgi:hypothetical protein
VIGDAGRRAPSGLQLRPVRRKVGVAGAIAVFALGVCGLGACGDDASGPSTVEGVYTLRRLNEEPLPYDDEGLGCCIYLAGTLDLEGGSYAAALTARNRNTGLVFTAMEWGTYTLGASSLAFAWDSVAVAPLLLDAGTVSADTLRVTFGGEGPGSPDQFRALYVRGPS